MWLKKTIKHKYKAAKNILALVFMYQIDDSIMENNE